MAMRFSDVVTTVSPSYAGEIGTSGFAFGPKEGKSYGETLEGRRTSGAFIGILNGLPADFINSQYQPDRKENEVRIIMASRATRQKGWQLFVGKIKEFVETVKPLGHNVKFDFLVDGTGDKDLLDELNKAAKENKDNVNLQSYDQNRMDAAFSRATIALMPSLWEPCGLFAMTAQARGVLLLATEVGGLSDILGGVPNTDSRGGVYSPLQKDLGGYPYVHYFGLGIQPGNIFGAISSVLANLRNPILSKIAADASARALKDYSPEAMAKRYMEQVYARFLKA